MGTGVENQAQQAVQTAADILPEWISQYRNLLIMIASCIGILGGLFGIAGYVSHTRRATVRAVRDDMLRLPAERKRVAAELRGNSRADIYERALRIGLDWLQRAYHGRHSLHGFLLSILFALAYAWIVFCASWGFGLASGALLGQEILPDWQSVRRLPTGLGLGILPLFVFFGIRWISPRIGIWQQDREKRLRENRPQLVWPFRLAFAAGLGLLGAGGVGIGDLLADGTIDKPFLLYAVAVAFAGAGAGARAVPCRNKERVEAASVNSANGLNPRLDRAIRHYDRRGWRQA